MGVENKAADALNHRVFILTKMSTVVSCFERLIADYESYPDFHEMYVELKDGTTREVDEFVLHDGYLFLSRKLCILRTSLREFLLLKLHVGSLAGQFENEKIIKAVEYSFYWPSLKHDVAKYVCRYHICQLARQRKHNLRRNWIWTFNLKSPPFRVQFRFKSLVDLCLTTSRNRFSWW